MIPLFKIFHSALDPFRACLILIPTPQDPERSYRKLQDTVGFCRISYDLVYNTVGSFPELNKIPQNSCRILYDCKTFRSHFPYQSHRILYDLIGNSRILQYPVGFHMNLSIILQDLLRLQKLPILFSIPIPQKPIRSYSLGYCRIPQDFI